MAKNVNVSISSENDGTTRANVPDWLVRMAVSWVDVEGAPQERDMDRYFLLQLNWLRQNHPLEARRMMEWIVYRIERVRQGIDDVEVLG